MMISFELVKAIKRRREVLRTNRNSYVPHWREIQDNISPDRGRGLSGQMDEREDFDGHKNRQHIYDSTPGMAIRVMANGLHAGLSSQASPWFKLSSGDPQLDRKLNVKRYLWECEEIMRAFFTRTKLYSALRHTYFELANFGTGALGQFESLSQGFRFRAYTVGEYYVAANADGQIDTFYRDMWMSASQMEQEFGRDNLSRPVQEALDRGAVDRRFLIYHAVEPNDGSVEIPGPRRPFRSVYIEFGAVDGKILSAGGLKRFPYKVPRWSTVGNSVYGDGVGKEILPDAKQLHKESEKKLVALDKIIDPPTVGSGDLTGMEINTIPGGHTQETVAGAGREGLRPLYQINLGIGEVTADIQDLRRQIQLGAYNSLFTDLLGRDGQPLTKAEVDARNAEKFSQLGPVLESIFDDLLKPTVDDSFDILAELGEFPPAPEELQGQELKVEFISPLAVAQRQLGLGSIEQFSAYLAQVAAVSPQVMDKVDLDKMVDVYADGTGVNPEILVDDEEVVEIRQRRAEQQAAQQAVEQGEVMAKSAKMLSETDTGGNTALSQTLDQLRTGTSTPASV